MQRNLKLLDESLHGMTWVWKSYEYEILNMMRYVYYRERYRYLVDNGLLSACSQLTVCFH